MGFVAIRVHGKTFPHRRNLIDDYGLEYDFRKKDFKGAFNSTSQRIEKLKVLLLSAGVTAAGGALLGQYLMYVDPGTFSGTPVSLQILFASIAGGMYTFLGPTVGAAFTITLTESLRIVFGTRFIGGANTIYGAMLIVFVIFMPQGIWGTLVGLLKT